MALTVGLQELVNHVLQNVAATPQHRDKRAIASRWGSVPCRGPAPNRTVALEEAWSSSPASLPNRGEWHILGTTYQTMRRRKRRATRERVTFFHHTTHSRSNCRCDLEPQCTTGGYTCSHRFWSVLCGPKLALFWDSCEQVGKIPIVGLLFSIT